MRFYPTKLHKGMVSGLIIMAAIALLLLFLFGCSQKVHRPRYNHWAKPYEMYAPVKAHKPHTK